MLSHGETNKSGQIYKIYCEIPLGLARVCGQSAKPIERLVLITNKSAVQPINQFQWCCEIPFRRSN